MRGFTVQPGDVFPTQSEPIPPEFRVEAQNCHVTPSAFPRILQLGQDPPQRERARGQDGRRAQELDGDEVQRRRRPRRARRLVVGLDLVVALDGLGVRGRGRGATLVVAVCRACRRRRSGVVIAVAVASAAVVRVRRRSVRRLRLRLGLALGLLDEDVDVAALVVRRDRFVLVGFGELGDDVPSVQEARDL